jgi:hypothetical protein
LDIPGNIKQLKTLIHLLEIGLFEFEERNMGYKRGKGGFVSLS